MIQSLKWYKSNTVFIRNSTFHCYNFFLLIDLVSEVSLHSLLFIKRFLGMLQVLIFSRHTTLSLLPKIWTLWITRFSESFNPKRCAATNIILKILRWHILFRVKFLRRKKELIAAKVLHTFPQTPLYKIFWTTLMCHTLPLRNQQLPPPHGRKLQHY